MPSELTPQQRQFLADACQCIRSLQAAALAVKTGADPRAARRYLIEADQQFRQLIILLNRCEEAALVARLDRLFALDTEGTGDDR